MKIFLMGYMGSGKSTIAHQLSQDIEIPWVDMDEQISQNEENTISEIFKKKGEIYFRKLETQILNDIIEKPSSVIVSLGGGTPCYGKNLDLIKRSPAAQLIYLKASVQFLTARLFSQKNHRPLISHLETKDNLEDFVRKHLFERGYYYNQARIIIDVEDKSPEDITAEIEEKLS